ncbi:MAG: hypothetical protein KatS3mg108_2326 [Isosphaeraceae bacterium]|nr:MAG: hypothetical protein KatS3mg108_2326 [Isosphaeraceae bacterium]
MNDRMVKPRPGLWVFVLVSLLGFLAGPRGFLGDPGTYWHLRLGREILGSGEVPRFDTLTKSRWGTPWVDQSWLFDAGYAALIDRLGWGAVVVATALLLGAVYAGLARWLVFRGASPTAAVASALVAAALGSVHFLSRPHLFTFAGVLATLVLCDLIHRGRVAWAWALPPLVALWANLHGGFLAGPLIVLSAAGYEAFAGLIDRSRWLVAVRFLLTGLGCLAAALINPYGWALYEHVLGLLVSSRVTDLIIEYQPVRWGQPELLLLEAVVMGLIVLPLATRHRPSPYDLTHALIWMHLGLASIRNLPLFGLAVAPVLAPMLDAALRPFTTAWPHQVTCRDALRGWAAAITAATWIAALGYAGQTRSPDPQRWPFAGLDVLNSLPFDAALFHEQDWGGLIESESNPRRLAWLDDRFELWGRQPIIDYAEALRGGGAWDELLEREQFTLAWLRPGRGLARRLDRDPAWVPVHRDPISVLYRRRDPPQVASTP